MEEKYEVAIIVVMLVSLLLASGLAYAVNKQDKQIRLLKASVQSSTDEKTILLEQINKLSQITNQSNVNSLIDGYLNSQALIQYFADTELPTYTGVGRGRVWNETYMIECKKPTRAPYECTRGKITWVSKYESFKWGNSTNISELK